MRRFLGTLCARCPSDKRQVKYEGAMVKRRRVAACQLGSFRAFPDKVSASFPMGRCDRVSVETGSRFGPSGMRYRALAAITLSMLLFGWTNSSVAAQLTTLYKFS